MPYMIHIDGEEWTVSEALYSQLAELIEECDDCSSEFSARLVAHPVNAEAADRVRAILQHAERAEPNAEPNASIAPRVPRR
jgi:hypothetical protein